MLESEDNTKQEPTKEPEYILKGIFQEFKDYKPHGRIYPGKDFLKVLEDLQTKDKKDDK